jgi:hypothetical protein
MIMFTQEIAFLIVVAVGMLVLMVVFSGGGTVSRRRSVGNNGWGIGSGRQSYHKHEGG